jgi:hypothetical protein
MSRLFRLLALLIVLVVVGGAVLLAAWRIPVPTAHVEKIIPNDRFPR